MELYVLCEANDIAALFPHVRPRDGVFDAFADHTAKEFPRCEARLPTGIWRDLYPERWAAMVADGGDESLIERAATVRAVRVAILERIPLAHATVAGFERGLHADLPANALTLIVPPPSIWSIDEAVEAAAACPGGRRFEPARFDALERHAGGRVTEAHVSRLRAAALRIAVQLPVEGLPVAGATLAAACTVISEEEGWCTAIAARHLALYASDPRIDRGP
jgi:hypothetical protein